MATQDSLIIGSESRPPVLYRDCYPQWRNRFLNWVAKQPNGADVKTSRKEGLAVHRNLVTKELLPPQKTLIPIPLGKKYGMNLKGEPLVKTYDRLCNVINDLRKEKVNKTEIELNVKFLRCLEEVWEPYGTQINVQPDFNKLNIHNLYEKLRLNEKVVLKQQAKIQESSSSDPLALVANRMSHLSINSNVEDTFSEFGDNDLIEVNMDDKEKEMYRDVAYLTRSFKKKYMTRRPTNNQLRTSSVSSYVKNNQAPKFDYYPGSTTGEKKFETPRSFEKKVAERKPEERKCYNCGQTGHLAINCTKPRQKNSTYYQNKLMLVKQQESGVALLAEDDKWLHLSDEETEQLAVNVCFMTKIKRSNELEDEGNKSETDDDEVCEFPKLALEQLLHECEQTARTNTSLKEEVANLTNALQEKENSLTDIQNKFQILQKDFKDLLTNNALVSFTASSELHLANQELELKVFELNKHVKELKIAQSSEMFRTNALAEDLEALQSKINDSNPSVKELQNLISDLNHACCIKDSQNQKLEIKIDELTDEIKFYKVKVYRIDQSNKQIFLNKPRDFDDFTKGLGFEDPKNLITGQLIVPPLYDENMMRYEEQLSKCETKINYDHINDSYDLFNLPLCPKIKKHSVIIVELDENSSEDSTEKQSVVHTSESKPEKEIVLPKPAPVRPYIPQSVLEKQIKDLKQILNEKQDVINALLFQNHHNISVPNSSSSVVYDCTDLSQLMCVIVNPTNCSLNDEVCDIEDVSVQPNWDSIKTNSVAIQTEDDCVSNIDCVYDEEYDEQMSVDKIEHIYWDSIKTNSVAIQTEDDCVSNIDCVYDEDYDEQMSVDKIEHIFPNLFDTEPLKFSEETESYCNEFNSLSKQYEFERNQRLNLLTELNKLKMEMEYKNIILQAFVDNNTKKATKLLSSGQFSKLVSNLTPPNSSHESKSSTDTSCSSINSTTSQINVQVYLDEIDALNISLEKVKKELQIKSTLFETREKRYCKIIQDLMSQQPVVQNDNASTSYKETSRPLKTTVPNVTVDSDSKNNGFDLNISKILDLNTFLEENNTYDPDFENKFVKKNKPSLKKTPPSHPSKAASLPRKTPKQKIIITSSKMLPDSCKNKTEPQTPTVVTNPSPKTKMKLQKQHKDQKFSSYPKQSLTTPRCTLKVFRDEAVGITRYQDQYGWFSSTPKKQVSSVNKTFNRKPNVYNHKQSSSNSKTIHVSGDLCLNCRSVWLPKDRHLHASRKVKSD
uniref:uncharacterized protein LOC122597115 n=1 Tax=Erigeron canadensis TaxID=72917 RepID=UPI001CB8D638|nr:uncharacterized protein LOC122597115 [Erigeron canadensis]